VIDTRRANAVIDGVAHAGRAYGAGEIPVLATTIFAL
jgi:hypothetical protein